MQLVILLFFVLMPSLALSAPIVASVSGLASDGQKLTITGTEFGVAGPHVLLFDDFSRGVDKMQLSTSATIGTWDSMPSIAFADSLLSKGMGARTLGEGGWFRANLMLFGATYQEVFMSSRGYVPSGYRFPNASGLKTLPVTSSLKHHWVYYDFDGYGLANKPDIISPSYVGAGWYAVTSDDLYTNTFDRESNARWVFNEPVRWSLWIKGNGKLAIGSNGLFQAVSSSGQTNTRYTNYQAWFTDAHIVSGFDRMTVVGWIEPNAVYPRDNYVIDDVYVAVGPHAAARVEIGNFSIYENSTKLAISTPDTWSDTKIVITVREGTFKFGEKAYLFVVNDNNVASSGIPFTFGGQIPRVSNPPIQGAR